MRRVANLHVKKPKERARKKIGGIRIFDLRGFVLCHLFRGQRINYQELLKKRLQSLI